MGRDSEEPLPEAGFWRVGESGRRRAVDRWLGAWYYGDMTMNAKHSRQRYEARAQIAKALAHPSRLMILDALADGEQCVCDLTRLVGADQSTVSKHLAILRNAGIIDLRRQGAMTFYRLRICCLQGLWACIESVLQDDLRQRQAALSEQQA